MNAKNTLHRVLRGGSWLDSSAADFRAACPVINTPLFRYDDNGFRTTQSGCCQVLKGGAKPSSSTPDPERFRTCSRFRVPAQ